MDFNSIKTKLIQIKEKVAEQSNKAIDYSAKKLANSMFTINKKEDFDTIIKKSASTTFTNKETSEQKTYIHKSIIIFAEEGSEFFKEALYMLPIIYTKCFTQNINISLSKSKIEGIELKDYNIDLSILPTLVVFENQKNIKAINGRENILKLVKSFHLDINKLIDNI